MRSAVAAALVMVLGGAACNGDDKNPELSTDAGVVQFRLLLADEPSDCGALPEKPEPTQRYTVVNGNQCVTLETATAAFQEAEVVFDEAVERPAVELRVKGDDAGELLALYNLHTGKTVAVVAFGRVITTIPSLQKAEGGRITLPPLSKNLAQRLRTELSD